jgi:hypothetical protein
MFDDVFNPASDDITDWMGDDLDGVSEADTFMRDVAAVMADQFLND